MGSAEERLKEIERALWPRRTSVDETEALALLAGIIAGLIVVVFVTHCLSPFRRLRCRFQSCGSLGPWSTSVSAIYATLVMMIDVHLSKPLAASTAEMSRADGALRALIVQKTVDHGDVTLEQVNGALEVLIAAFNTWYFTAVYLINLSMTAQVTLERYLLPALFTLLPFYIYDTVPTVAQFSNNTGTITLLLVSLTSFNMIPAKAYGTEAKRERFERLYEYLCAHGPIVEKNPIGDELL